MSHFDTVPACEGKTDGRTDLYALHSSIGQIYKMPCYRRENRAMSL